MGELKIKLRMQIILRKLVCLIFFFPLVNSSRQLHLADPGPEATFITRQQVSCKLVLEIRIHGLLLWVSMGFLIPLSILAIRSSNSEQCGRRLRFLFLIHALSQTVSLVVVTIGAAMSIKNFNNSFKNFHQRMGVALYAIIWLQALLGLLRPHRGSKGRSIWFLTHWLIGTALCILGILNICTGLHAYHQKTGKNIQLWIIFFTIEISLIAFFYLFQDKWVYIQKQGLIFGNEPMETPISSTGDKLKVSVSDSNALP